jgi:hypothetical protein
LIFADLQKGHGELETIERVDPANCITEGAMAADETGKSRSQRIALDYFRRRTGLDSWRWLAISAALIAVTPFAVWSMMPRGSSMSSTGPLSMAHASLQNNCTACHGDQTLGAPIAVDAWRPSPLQAVTQVQQACTQCHRDLGHHFPDQLNDRSRIAESDCSQCHREHEGSLQVLSHVANSRCIDCHGNLSDHIGSELKPTVAQRNIHRFDDATHGKFTSLERPREKGRVLFDHVQHMLPGQQHSQRVGGMIVGQLTPTDRARYAPEAAVTDLVQLNCASCHQSPLPTSSIESASDQRHDVFFAPVDFNRHCEACHALGYAGQSADQLPLPHAAPWSEIDELVRAKWNAATAAGRRAAPRGTIDAATASSSHDDPLILPGTNSLIDSVIPDETDRKASIEVSIELEMMRGKCLKCHAAEDTSGDAIAAAAIDPRPWIPNRWLHRSFFPHGLHHNVACKTCHPQTMWSGDGSPPEQPPMDTETVMIGNIETCVPCHREPTAARATAVSPGPPIPVSGTATQGLSNCIHCHRYHWTRPSNDLANADSAAAPIAAGVDPHSADLPP